MSEIFLLRGFVRSGTNWLSRLMNLHPDINCQGEFHLYPFKQFYNEYREQYGPGSCIFQNDKEPILKAEFNRFLKSVIRRYCEADKYQIVGNRTPAGLGDMWLPNCKHLLISRDGRSVVTSWFFHVLNNHPNSPDVTQFPQMVEKVELIRNNPNYFLENPQELLNCEGFFKKIVKRWSDRVVNDQRFCTLADNGDIPLDYHWVKYENLHMNTTQRRKEIYEYLGVEPSKAEDMSDSDIAGFNVKETSNIRKRGSLDGWMKFFNEEYDQWFSEIAGNAMEIHLSKN